MAYGTLADPVPGTVITVAYAVSNLLNPIRWVRLMTGNADPPGSAYVVVSDSTTGTTWRKVPADALAAGVAVANLGYTPANKAGDTMSGSLLFTGFAGVQFGGNSGATPGFLGDVAATATRFLCHADTFITYTQNGLTELLRASASALTYKGATIWTSDNDGPGSTLDADLLDGAHASATPAASTVPIANGSGKLANGWLNTGSGNGIDADSVDGSHANTLLARGNHTGTQLANTISDLAAAVAGLASSTATSVTGTGVITSAHIANGTITDTDVATANKDGAGPVASMRTLGTGAAQAAAGNHDHASSYSVLGHAHTGSDITDLSLTDADMAAANQDGAAGTPSMRTLGTGAAQAAAGNHTHSANTVSASGTYAGNSGTQSVALGISAKLVIITEVTDSANGLLAHAIAGKTFSSRLTSGTAFNASDASNGISGTNLSPSFTAGANTSGKTYSWVAFA